VIEDIADVVVRHLVDKKYWDMRNNNHDCEQEDSSSDEELAQQRGMERYSNVPMRQYRHYHVGPETTCVLHSNVTIDPTAANKEQMTLKRDRTVQTLLLRPSQPSTTKWDTLLDLGMICTHSKGTITIEDPFSEKHLVPAIVIVIRS